MNNQRKPILTQQFTEGDLKEAESVIIQEYNKLCDGPLTDSSRQIEILEFSTVPEQFPKAIHQNFSKFFGLGQCLLYEMFTVVIFEHLYSGAADPGKKETIRNLKRLIYDQNFMQGNFYTKGLMIQSFRILDSRNCQNTHFLVTEPLAEKGLIRAFVECWKALVDLICLEYSLSTLRQQDQLEVIELLSAYFKIQFGVAVKKNGQINQLISCNNNQTHISLVFNNEQEYSLANDWKCFIFLHNVNRPPPQSKTLKFLTTLQKKQSHPAILQEHPENIQSPIHEQSSIIKIEENESQMDSQQLKIILDNKYLQKTAARKEDFRSPRHSTLTEIIQNSRSTIKKGQKLLNRFKQFFDTLDQEFPQSVFND